VRFEDAMLKVFGFVFFVDMVQAYTSVEDMINAILCNAVATV